MEEKATSHLDSELKILKDDVLALWELVSGQLEKGKQALLNYDKNLAKEVISKEKRVNAYELKIDRDCENIFALFNPVAIDLRFVLAVLKINSNLERIGDIADGVARYVVDLDNQLNEELLSQTRVLEMYDASIRILLDTEKAFDKEDPDLARTIFLLDEKIDEINNTASYSVSKFIQAHPNQIRPALHLLSIIRKLERVGDQAKNIAEEIIFYIEAKVLRHRSKEQKQKL